MFSKVVLLYTSSRYGAILSLICGHVNAKRWHNVQCSCSPLPSIVGFHNNNQFLFCLCNVYHLKSIIVCKMLSCHQYQCVFFLTYSNIQVPMASANNWNLSRCQESWHLCVFTSYMVLFFWSHALSGEIIGCPGTIWWRMPAILRNWSAIFLDGNRAAHMSPYHSCLHCSVGCRIASWCSCGWHIKTDHKQTRTFRVYFFPPLGQVISSFCRDRSLWPLRRGVRFIKAGGSDWTNSWICMHWR